MDEQDDFNLSAINNQIRGLNQDNSNDLFSQKPSSDFDFMRNLDLNNIKKDDQHNSMNQNQPKCN